MESSISLLDHEQRITALEVLQRQNTGINTNGFNHSALSKTVKTTAAIFALIITNFGTEIFTASTISQVVRDQSVEVKEELQVEVNHLKEGNATIQQNLELKTSEQKIDDQISRIELLQEIQNLKSEIEDLKQLNQ